MNIRFLETFLWLARLKSFSATAERLNTTQPAISARLRTLEQELGVELIFRTSREVHVTPEGLGILRHVEAILDLAHLIENDVTRDGVPAGIVRVGVVDAILRTWLPRPIEALRARYAKLSVEVHGRHDGATCQEPARGRPASGRRDRADPRPASDQRRSLQLRDGVGVEPAPRRFRRTSTLRSSSRNCR